MKSPLFCDGFFMPHLILECSNDIFRKNIFDKLFLEIHESLEKNLPTMISSCKSRVIPYEHYFIGSDFANKSFVHLTIKILPGRTEEIKLNTGNHVLEILKKTFIDLNSDDIKLSVEIVELSDRYFKM